MHTVMPSWVTKDLPPFQFLKGKVCTTVGAMFFILPSPDFVNNHPKKSVGLRLGNRCKARKYGISHFNAKTADIDGLFRQNPDQNIIPHAKNPSQFSKGLETGC